MIRRNGKTSHLQTANNIKQHAYSIRYETTRTEINALRTKVAITLGLFGVLFTIFFTYTGISKETFENYIFIILLVSVVLVGSNYLLTYIQIHNLKHIVYPTDDVMKMIGNENNRSKMEKYLYDDLKITCEKLSLDHLFYSQIIQVLDLFFIFSLIISFAGYIIFNNSSVDITMLEATYSFLLIIFIIIEFTVMISLINSMILGMKDNFRRIVVQTEGIIRFVLLIGGLVLLFYSPYIFLVLSTIISDNSPLQIFSVILYIILAVIVFFIIAKETANFAKDFKRAIAEIKEKSKSSNLKKNEN